MEDKIKLTDEMLNDVNGGNNQNGLTCPRCHARIATTIEQIIKTRALICPTCGLRLDIDSKK